MWIPLALVSVLLCCPVQATNFNCTRCESSLGWTDCSLNSTVQSCPGKNGSFQACFRAELTTLPEQGTLLTFVQGCATKPTFCTDWNAKVSVRQCSLCPEGTPQEPCSVQPPLGEIDLDDGEQVEINVMVTKHGGSRAGGGPNEGSVVTRQFLATGPNGQPMVVVVLNGSTGPPREAWRPAGPPDVIDWQNEPGVFEIFPYGWNETVDGGAAMRVRFGTGFAVLVAVLSLAVANFC